MTEANGRPEADQGSRGQHAETGVSRSAQLDRVLTELVSQVPEIEAASVVSFDGLPMAAALPVGMDEDRVAAMSAALLSLGERAADGLGRGELSQVYVEGENGTVFLVSADDEAVLVAVAAKGAKVGLMLFEVRRAAAAVAGVLRVEPFWAESVGDDELPEPGVDESAAEPHVLTALDAQLDAPLDGPRDPLTDAPADDHSDDHQDQPAPLRAVPEGNWFSQRQGSLMPTSTPSPSELPNWS